MFLTFTKESNKNNLHCKGIGKLYSLMYTHIWTHTHTSMYQIDIT